MSFYSLIETAQKSLDELNTNPELNPISRLNLSTALRNPLETPASPAIILALATLDYISSGKVFLERAKIAQLLKLDSGKRTYNGLLQAIDYLEDLLEVLNSEEFLQGLKLGDFSLGAIKPNLGESPAYDYAHGRKEHPHKASWFPQANDSRKFAESRKLFDSQFTRYLQFFVINEKAPVEIVLPFNYCATPQAFEKTYQHLRTPEKIAIYTELENLFLKGGAATGFIMKRKKGETAHALDLWRSFVGPERNANKAKPTEARTIFAQNPQTDIDGSVQNGFHGARDTEELLIDHANFRQYVTDQLAALRALREVLQVSPLR